MKGLYTEKKEFDNYKLMDSPNRMQSYGMGGGQRLLETIQPDGIGSGARSMNSVAGSTESLRTLVSTRNVVNNYANINIKNYFENEESNSKAKVKKPFKIPKNYIIE